MRKGTTMGTNKLRFTARNAGLAAFAAALTLGLAAGVAQATPAAQGHTDGTHTGRMYGDPAAAAPYWVEQSLDDCALMATADVIGQLTGHQISEREIIAAAQTLPSQSHPGPIYTLPKDMSDPNKTGHGTDPHDIPVLLARYGITGVITNEDDADTTGLATGMDALEHYLADGQKVIVGVNAELIWGKPVQIKNKNGGPAPDHAVVVTGVDTANGKVHLNDSGTEHGKDETVPIALFAKSWATSDDQMVVTEETS
jgi:hypothetical protein